MKTQKLQFIAIMTLAGITSLVMAIAITHIGILTNDPMKTWLFPVLIGIGLLWWLINTLIDLRLSLWYKRHLALEETGVFEYLRCNTAFAHAEPLSKDATAEEYSEWFKQAIEETSGETYDTYGVVCGEEVIGVVEGMRIVVTVTKPETAKAFRRLPRGYRKFVTVMELLE
jgi:hypothetical protein